MRPIIGPSTLPPSSTKCSTPAACIASTLSRQRTRPVTCSTSRRCSSPGSVDRRGGDVGVERQAQGSGRGLAQRLGHRVGGGLHQRAVERRGDRQQHAALDAVILDQRDRALDRLAVAREHDLRRDRCRWRLCRPRPRPPRRPAPAPCRYRRRAARTSRRRRPAPPPASPARAASAAARCRPA